MANERQHGAREKPKMDLATQRFYFLIGILALTLAFVIASIVMWAITPRPSSQPSESANGGIFSVKTIEVEGNTRYMEEAVIGESGIRLGQSIFKVDGQKVEKQLAETFPYFESVEVQTLHMKEVRIIVRETAVIGAVYETGCWIPVGANGKALDKQAIVSDRPKGMLYIKGVKLPEGGVAIGGPAMDEVYTEVLDEMMQAFEQYGLKEIVEIDLSDLSDVRMNWRDQIEIRLGNTTNLTHEIGVVANTIPSIIQSRGEHITGVLNVSSYSNDALENMGIFTPSSLLTTSTTAPRRTEEEIKGETEEGVTTTTQFAESGNN